ncbi:LysR family transcriptional regulator [Pseudodonghicola flavimaris]|uniref:LysR substrate-binding domain-containing protein n=1 Tax=Pseudodonghicola flavimaris TaxID=3050036 RepID=A0ABT7F163_9RHOB|nr:LysR family transcriptional regulator [Pseudodonghicola flavimaris]MDK3018338.1 LysR substrate-binding domain-containing protein [Pseudodonghicola flavimaris]
MKLTLRQIEIFQAVVEQGNFSRAAERLNTTQPSLSQAIRDLEDALGARLFDRTTRRVDLTEAGRAFAASALSGLGAIERAVSNVRDLSTLRGGRIRIAAPPLLAATALPRFVRRAARAHPGLQIQIADVGTDAILDRVRSGQAEIGIGTFHPAEDGLQSTSILQDSLMVFMPENHPLAAQPVLNWRALRDLPIATLTRESGIRLLVDVGFESARQPLRPAFEAHQIFTLLSLVEAGQAVAVLPAYSQAALYGRAVAVRPLTDPVISRDVSVIRARDRSAPPAVQALLPLLRTTLREMVEEVLTGG